MNNSKKRGNFIWPVLIFVLFLVYLLLHWMWQIDLGTYLLCSGIFMTTVAGTYMGDDKYRNKYKGILLSLIWVFGFICFISAIYVSSENYKFVTGCDSYCYFKFVSIPKSENEFYMIVKHKGKYPLENVRVNFFDLTEVNEIRKSGGDVATAIKDYRVGDIPIGIPIRHGNLKLENTDNKEYEARFYNKYGMWVENIRLRYNNEKWTQAFEVWTSAGGNKPIFKYSDPGYPK